MDNSVEYINYESYMTAAGTIIYGVPNDNTYSVLEYWSKKINSVKNSNILDIIENAIGDTDDWVPDMFVCTISRVFKYQLAAHDRDLVYIDPDSALVIHTGQPAAPGSPNGIIMWSPPGSPDIHHEPVILYTKDYYTFVIRNQYINIMCNITYLSQHTYL